MAYVVINEFQFLVDTKIHRLTKGTRLEREENGYFVLVVENGTSREATITIPKEVATNNPEFFKEVDLASDITDILKAGKSLTVAKQAKGVAEFIENKVLNNYTSNNILADYTLVDCETIVVMLQACLNHALEYEGDYKNSPYYAPLEKLGWYVSSNQMLMPPLTKQELPVKPIK